MSRTSFLTLFLIASIQYAMIAALAGQYSNGVGARFTQPTSTSRRSTTTSTAASTSTSTSSPAAPPTVISSVGAGSRPQGAASTINIPPPLITAVAPPLPVLQNSVNNQQPSFVSAQFSSSLYKNLSADIPSTKSIAFSPLSIEAAMAMAQVGAQGRTRQEIASALGTVGSPGQIAQRFRGINSNQKGYILNSANGMFVEQSFQVKPTYRTIIADQFNATVQNVDFKRQAESVRKLINSFVSSNTNGEIPQLFPAGSLGSDTALVLVNAVYFKANWLNAFNKSLTKDEPFNLANGGKKTVPMMSASRRMNYTESRALGAHVVELPYQTRQMSMFLILPVASGANQLGKVEAALNAESLYSALNEMDSTPVDLWMPRFKMNTDYDLISALKGLGIVNAFSDSADFSGIAQGGGLKISKVMHKVFMDVDETGTEAAAATGVQIIPTSFIPPVEFRADRPFMFLIRHNPSGAIVFMGRVSDPSAT